MGNLRQYFDTDFSDNLRLKANVTVSGCNTEAAILYDFTGMFLFCAYYVDGKERNCSFFSQLIENICGPRTPFRIDGTVTLPSAKAFRGNLQLSNKEDFEIASQFLGGSSWVSSKKFQLSQRVFIYSESTLSEDEIIYLQEQASKIGKDVQFRTEKYAMLRAQSEMPLAFISHDSRDKDAVARVIAINLEKMMCPVWYDEFSLKVGDPLRESIEKGLKECHKCILILSPNFLSNNGWTKKEFESIFQREILEGNNVILPVWYNVTKQDVYNYSPSLLNIVGVNWNTLGEQEVCRQLHRVLTA